MSTTDHTPPDRTSWTFQVQESEIRDAAKREAAYHRTRETWWLNEAHRVETKIRDTGVTFTELQQTGGPRFEARIDLPLGDRLNQARQKVEAHGRQADEFEAYVIALHGGQIRHLTFGDIKFFRIGFPEWAPQEDLA